MPWSVYVVDSEAEISTFINDFTDEGDAYKERSRLLLEDLEDEEGMYVEIRESK
jgi:hypothetical protein